MGKASAPQPPSLDPNVVAEKIMTTREEKRAPLLLLVLVPGPTSPEPLERVHFASQAASREALPCGLLASDAASREGLPCVLFASDAASREAPPRVLFASVATPLEALPRILFAFDVASREAMEMECVFFASDAVSREALPRVLFAYDCDAASREALARVSQHGWEPRFPVAAILLLLHGTIPEALGAGEVACPTVIPMERFVGRSRTAIFILHRGQNQLGDMDLLDGPDHPLMIDEYPDRCDCSPADCIFHIERRHAMIRTRPSKVLLLRSDPEIDIKHLGQGNCMTGDRSTVDAQLAGGLQNWYSFHVAGINCTIFTRYCFGEADESVPSAFSKTESRSSSEACIHPLIGANDLATQFLSLADHLLDKDTCMDPGNTAYYQTMQTNYHDENQIAHVMFLAGYLHWVTRQVLITICSMHLSGRSNGAFNSSHILYHNGRVVFNDIHEEAAFTEDSLKKDFWVAGVIFRGNFLMSKEEEFSLLVDQSCQYISNCTAGDGSKTQIFVKIEGSSVSMQVDLSTTTTKMLVEQACERKRIRCYDSYAVYLGKRLDDNKLLANCKVCSECTIEVRIRTRADQIQRIRCKTFDEKLKGHKLFHAVKLPRTLTNSENNIATATFLSAHSRWVARQVLITLCRMHFRGKSFNGTFSSSDILFHDGRVIFNDTLRKVKFTEEACKKDFRAIGLIFRSKFRISYEEGFPLFVNHLLQYLLDCPAGEHSNTIAAIAYLINHPALTSYTDRIAQCSTLDSMVSRLDHSELAHFDIAVGPLENWADSIFYVPAMDDIIFYDPNRDEDDEDNDEYKDDDVVYVPYCGNPRGCLHYARNFFKHAGKQLQLEKIEAAFCLNVKDFLANLLQNIALKFEESAPVIFDTIELLGDNVADMKEGEEE